MKKYVVEYHEDEIGNFQEGETVLIDKGHRSEQRATIINFFDNVWCRVKNEEGYEWDVMILRISKP